MSPSITFRVTINEEILKLNNRCAVVGVFANNLLSIREFGSPLFCVTINGEILKLTIW